MEHLIEDSDGNSRSLRPGNLVINKHKGVRDVFKLLYEWYKTKYLKTNWGL
jgi:hypothetical protein